MRDVPINEWFKTVYGVIFIMLINYNAWNSEKTDGNNEELLSVPNILLMNNVYVCMNV